MLRVSTRAAVAILVAVLLSSLGVAAGPAMADTTDVTPPGQVTNVQITTYYQVGDPVHLTPPTDPDYDNFLYAVAPGGDAASQPFTSCGNARSGSTSNGPEHGDRLHARGVAGAHRARNTSEPVLTHFATLLDTHPPHP